MPRVISRSLRTLSPLLCAIVLLDGCSASALTHARTTAVHEAAATPKPAESADVSATTKLQSVARVGLTEIPRTVEAGALVSLSGQAKILSDAGSGIIANNGGGIISNNSGGIVSDNGSGIIANNGGGIVSDNGSGIIANNGGGYAVLAATPPVARTEALLADAQIEVLDALGHVLVDAKQQPIITVSDKTGHYKLSAKLPDEDLVLRIRLFNGGQLFALLPRSLGAPSQTLDLDTASSLGARYVLDTYVNKQQNILDKLPMAEAQALHTAMEAARVLLTTKVPSYLPADLLASAQMLVAKNAPVNTEVLRIRAILLAGQANLGDGLAATEVSLAAPGAVLPDGAGGFYVAESLAGRVRHIDSQGLISQFAGGKGELVNPVTLLALADGSDSMLVADSVAGLVKRIDKNGKITPFAGGATDPNAPLEVAATSAYLHRPTALALGTDGSVYIGEVPQSAGYTARMLQVDTHGVIHLVTPPTVDWDHPLIAGMVVGLDNTLYVINGNTGDEPSVACVQRRSPTGVWDQLAPGTLAGITSRLALGPDGSLYESLDQLDVIQRIAPDGSVSVFAGTHKRGYSPDGTVATQAMFDQPSGLAFGPDGKLYVTEIGNGLIRVIDPKAATPTLTTLAGTRSPTQIGSGTAISISSPLGLALDPTGDVVLSEATGNTIKRLDGQTLSVIAGSTQGPAVNNVSALAATFNTPAGIAYDGTTLYVLDSQNRAVRKIDAAGNVSIVAQSPPGATQVAAEQPATAAALQRPLCIAISPTHVPYFTDNQGNRVWRIRADGVAEVVVGLTSPGKGGSTGDLGPAQAAQLSLPTALAFDAAGNLYIADTGNLVIRRVEAPAGPQSTISTYAGLAADMALGELASGPVPDTDDPKQAILFGPEALAFDAAGNLYEAEAGSGEITALSATLAALLAGHDPNVGARIRRVSQDGKKITTVAGDGAPADSGADVTLATPIGLAFDQAGHLIVADSGLNQLLLLPLSTP